MDIPALEEGESEIDLPRPSRYERIRAAAAARGIPLSAILASCGVVVVIYLAGKIAYRMLDVLLMIAVAGFLSVILNPLVAYVERRVRRRGWAVAIVIVWATLVFIGLAALFGYPLLNGVTHLARELPSYTRDAADGHGWVGQLIRRLRLQQWVAHNAPKLQTVGASLARPALSIGKGAVSLIGTLLTIFAITTLVLVEGPKMRAGLLSSLSPERADRWARVGREINQSMTGYVVGNLATSLIAGVVIFADIAALGLPFPLLWGLWVAIVDFLPMVGGALAGIPTVLFALAHSLTAGLVTAAVFVAYQQLENHVLNPLIMSKTVKVSPLLVLMSVLLGTSLGDWAGGVFGGFVAALISIPCAAALQVIAGKSGATPRYSPVRLSCIGQVNIAERYNHFYRPATTCWTVNASGIRRLRSHGPKRGTLYAQHQGYPGGGRGRAGVRPARRRVEHLGEERQRGCRAQRHRAELPAVPGGGGRGPARGRGEARAQPPRGRTA